MTFAQCSKISRNLCKNQSFWWKISIFKRRHSPLPDYWKSHLWLGGNQVGRKKTDPPGVLTKLKTVCRRVSWFGSGLEIEIANGTRSDPYMICRSWSARKPYRLLRRSFFPVFCREALRVRAQRRRGLQAAWRALVLPSSESEKFGIPFKTTITLINIKIRVQKRLYLIKFLRISPNV